MSDLADGQTVEVRGSAARPYQLKNIGGVYSCSCPAWRNQSLPIDRRSCKHLRSYLGEAAEAARVGGEVSPASTKASAKPVAPPILLAETWTDDLDPRGWWLSEKLDGVRAYWDGTRFLSRNGNRYFAPRWFTTGLPAIPLDGELWIGRKQFQQTVSIVRRQDSGDAWQQVRYIVFDAPQITGPFEERMAAARDLLPSRVTSFAQAMDHNVCRDRNHLAAELTRIESLGGEGLMLRQPGSFYVTSRSPTLLKVKRFRDCEAVVIGHQPGTGRHRGRLGALIVRLASGVECAVGTGFSDAQREQPPAIGGVITLKYQELTSAGVPRFPQASAVGSFLVFTMSFVTLSFLITTPECWVPALGDAQHGFPYLSGAGRLVVKDAIMMGAALVTMADSAKAYLRSRASSFTPSRVALNEERLVTASVR